MIDFQRRPRIVKLLLDHGAKPEGDDLASAARWPTAETLRELLLHVDDVDKLIAMPRNRRRLLHVLCAESTIGERLEKIKLVTDAGADLNIKDESGNTPLHIACSRCYGK